VKLKVGRRTVARDAERVQALRRGLGAGPSLRLDANRAWSLDRALAFAGALGPECAPEYIEEPLRDPTQLPTFAEQSGLPVALDETTRERGPSVLSALAPIAAVVLKPTLIGGATATRSWAEAARDVGATPVVSASYESGVGLRLLVVLAAALSDAPAGLSTYARLAADTLTPRLALDGPTVDVAATGESRVHPDRITRITDSESA
jgi:O-succinylbenzoate synthase